MSDRDDVVDALADLLGKQIAAGTASTAALQALATELGAFRGRLDALARVEAAMEESTKALDALRPLLEELAARRAADVAAREAAVRSEGYAKGKADAQADALASPVQSARWSLSTAIRSDGGRAAVLALVVALAWGLVHLALPGVPLPPVPGVTP